jgi:hypothetical protein
MRSLRREHNSIVGNDEQVELGPFSLSFEALVRSLRRNFNGVSPADFEVVMKTFLEKCNVAVPPVLEAQLTSSEIRVLNEQRYLAPRPLDTLRVALRDSDVQTSEDMNNSPFRHVMVISETLDIVLEQLRRHNPQQPPVIVYVSSFSGNYYTPLSGDEPLRCGREACDAVCPELEIILYGVLNLQVIPQTSVAVSWRPS